jgi:hypothetical protein
MDSMEQTVLQGICGRLQEEVWGLVNSSKWIREWQSVRHASQNDTQERLSRILLS